jgi:hypothetical protein
MSKKRVSDDLLLAGMDRAERHRRNSNSGVPMWDVKRHSGIPKHAQGIRAQLEALVNVGLLEHHRRSSIDVWSLTTSARERLQRAQRSSTVLVLPESPQHEAWRNARALAEQELDGFRRVLKECLGEAEHLLATDAASDAWFGIAPRLRNACWRVGSATYCLREWVEPDDARADIDELTPAEKKLDQAKHYRLKSLRTGRRNPLNWLAQDD